MHSDAVQVEFVRADPNALGDVAEELDLLIAPQPGDGGPPTSIGHDQSIEMGPATGGAATKTSVCQNI